MIDVVYLRVASHHSLRLARVNFHEIATKNQIKWLVVSDLFISADIHTEAPKRTPALKIEFYIFVQPLCAQRLIAMCSLIPTPPQVDQAS